MEIRKTMEIRLAPITPEDGRAIIDLFNHYVTHSFAAFPEESLMYPFFDRFLEATRGYLTVTAKAADGHCRPDTKGGCLRSRANLYPVRLPNPCLEALASSAPAGIIRLP
jgi:hypothetical protein